MAFKSKAHRSKMRELLAAGKITRAQYDEIEKDTPAILPDRVTDEDSVDTDQKPKDKKRTSPFW